MLIREELLYCHLLGIDNNTVNWWGIEGLFD